MQFMLLFSRQGKLRLQKWYVPLSDKEKKKITRELVQTVLARKPKMCSFLEWRDLKIVYKRWARGIRGWWRKVRALLWLNTGTISLSHGQFSDLSFTDTKHSQRKCYHRETMGERVIIFASLRPRYCAGEEKIWQTVGEPMWPSRDFAPLLRSYKQNKWIPSTLNEFSAPVFS